MPTTASWFARSSSSHGEHLHLASLVVGLDRPHGTEGHPGLHRGHGEPWIRRAPPRASSRDHCHQRRETLIRPRDNAPKNERRLRLHSLSSSSSGAFGFKGARPVPLCCRPPVGRGQASHTELADSVRLSSMVDHDPTSSPRCTPDHRRALTGLTRPQSAHWTLGRWFLS